MPRHAGVLLLAITVAGCAATPAPPFADEGPAIDDIRAQADIAWQHGNSAAAVEGYRKILRKQPDNREALLGIGEGWLALGESEQALLAFGQLLALAPEAVDAAEGQALALLGTQRYAEASAAFMAIDARAPGRWRTCNALGLLADLRGEYEAAQEWYRRALAANRQEAVIWNNFGWSRVMARDFRAGESLLQEALVRKPGAPRINANLAVAIAWQGDYERATRVAMRTASQHVAYNDVGYIALLRGDAAAAVGYFQAAIDQSPAWFPRAAANLERARREVAAKR